MFVPIHQPQTLLRNILRNGYFPISALAFFYPEIQLGMDFCQVDLTGISLLIVFVILLVFSSQQQNLWQAVRIMPWWLNVFCMLTVGGVSYCLYQNAITFLEEQPVLLAWQAAYPDIQNLPELASLFLALIASLFVYVCLALFWKYFSVVIQELAIFQKLTFYEIVFYILLVVGTILLSALVYSHTEVFYGMTGTGYDTIYTSDSGGLLSQMAYLALSFPENDLRQPLFAVFSAPFVGAPYLLSQIFHLSLSSEAILINSLQIPLLFAGHLALAKALRLSPVQRSCFVLISSLTYAHLLSTLMIEQYVVAYFWLCITICALANRYHAAEMPLYVAGGTLLTSLALLPFISMTPFRESVLKWSKKIISSAFGFLILLLACGRFDVLYSVGAKLLSLSTFSGKTVSLSERLRQYTHFIHDCILAPAAHSGINYNTTIPHISWMHDTANTLSIIGIALFILASFGAILTFRQRISRLAIFWIFFSVVLLLIVGWGTKENGLILYALYFSWAFVILLFQLPVWLDQRLHTNVITPLSTILFSALLVFYNVHGLWDMVSFGINYYPVG